MFAFDGVVEGSAVHGWALCGGRRFLLSPSGLAADSEPAEQVGVDEQVEDLVDGDVADGGGGRQAGVGEVVVVGARVGAQPLPDRQDVVAGLGFSDVEGVGDFVWGCPEPA